MLIILGKYAKKRGERRNKSRVLVMESGNTKAKRWLVIIIGDRERHGPFEVTRRLFIFLLVCLAIFLIVVVAGSAWLCSRPLLMDNRELQADLATARGTIDLMSTEKEELLGENEQLRRQLEISRTAIEKKRNLTVAEKRKKAPVVPAEKNVEITPPAPFISVEEVQIAHNADTQKLKIRFIIRKDCDEEHISGYVFIILNPPPDSSALRRVSPSAELDGGFPRLYKKGENFAIARFKYIEGVFLSIPDKDKYSSFSVLIYEDNGNLRLNKELPL